MTWQLKLIKVEYIYKPHVKRKKSAKNTVSLYWNHYYTAILESYSDTHINVKDVSLRSILDNTYIKDTAFATEWPKLATFNGSSILKDVNHDAVTVSNFDWRISTIVCEESDDGIFKTSVRLAGRQKYWLYTGIKYTEPKVNRMFKG